MGFVARRAPLFLLLCGSLLAPAAWAYVVNVDFNASVSDAVHVGADGVLSGTGTFWNGVLVDTAVNDVLDEDGVLRDLTVYPCCSGGTDGTATNDLQDSGSTDGFDLWLPETETYTLVVYGGAGLSFSVTDASGTNTGSCTGLPTYSLPGTAGLDYCVFSGLAPYFLGDDIFGLTISGVDGLITGFQIETVISGDAPPSVPTLGAAGTLSVAFGLATAGCVALRRRWLRS